MDATTAWNLVRGGTIARLAHDGADAIVELDALGTRLALRHVEHARFEYRPDDVDPLSDGAWLVDGDAIVARAGAIAAVRTSRGRARVRCGDGTLVVACARVEPSDELRGVARAWWDARVAAPIHPALQLALDHPPRVALPPLVEAWRAERTSELGDAIAIADARDHDELGAELAVVVRRVEAAGWSPDWKYDDESRAARSREWEPLARALGALRAAAPDPRIARAVEAMLWDNNSNDWFRVDQVAHIVAHDKPHDEPSFADHALWLLAHHADAGTAARLDELATLIRFECDCNGAEMSDRLTALANELDERFTADHSLDEAIAGALWAR